MREPIERRASFFDRASLASQPCKGHKHTFIRPFVNAFGLSLVLASFTGTAAFAQSTDYTTLPAVMSPQASTALLIDAAQAGDRLVAVGSRGHIVYSDDQGLSWSQAAVPTRQLLSAVYFVDDQHGWAVGHDSLILHTKDGGLNWVIQYRDPALEEERDEEGLGLLERPLMDVWFRDAKTGFAVGAYGLMLRTDDGGATWEDRSSDIDNPDGFHYNALTTVRDAGLFLVGEMGTMYRSPDFGETWETLQELPYDGSWFGTSGTLQPNVVLAWGLRGNVFRSDNFGDSWEQVELMTPRNGPLESTLSGGGLSKDGKLTVVGVGGVVATSEDAGRTFSVAIRPDRVALASAEVLDGGQLLLLGQNGAVKATANGLPLNQ
ncbi:MAG TPA: hypothetical protein ENI17_00930 [Pseudomonas xinjiangensis]|uniref:Photosynthesis system II assembly factor Ycf48/Hcf136-like domain-containing protein n=2 Tax=root TaxID=1 RepID=A0A7V1BQE6_9GAMM|nr:hypothetical protein [Halopseudomonas xinjiangensis]HEC46184.1 hypothetical protein [Halopseudomonas xinjiangensis]